MTDDEKLIYNIKRKRRGALEKAIDLYTPYIGTVIYNVIGSAMPKEDMEEIISDTFVTLWRNADKFDSKKGCLRTYLGTIARNLAKNRLSAQKINSELNENIISIHSEPHTEIEREEERASVIRAINELGEPECEIFMRYYYYDEKISDISKIMGLPANTVKTKLARGRRKLTETLTKEVNAEIPALNSTLNKVIISPLGSQLVITRHELNRRFMSDSFAILDENGEFIHMTPENSRLYDEGDTEEVRTVPIMLGGRIPESLTIIPYEEEPEISMIDGYDVHKAEDFPFEMKIGDRGRVIVTDVRYYDAKLEIDYRLEGDTLGFQMIYPVNDEGWNEMRADDGVWRIDETVWHMSTESYTAVFDFVIGEADQNGDVPSAGALRGEEILKERFKSVRISYQTNAPEPDYDNAVKIDLK